jgi:UPF0042 nucleotide-binding protein
VEKAQVVIVTGLSGSGKSTAIKALEDIGYFCVDNLPVGLLEKFLVLADQHAQVSRVAFGVDVRERAFLGAFDEAIEGLRRLGHSVHVLFLDASDDVLIRRFSETRRRHPLEGEAGSISDAIALERRVLDPVRMHAARVVTTDGLNVHQLKALVQEQFDPAKTVRMAIALMSFGFRNGTPREADYMFDCRLLPNPYFVEDLRVRDGRDPEVRRFLEGRVEWKPLCEKIFSLLEFAIPLHEAEGKPSLTVAFGCTGGRHRSTAMVEAIAAMLREKGHRVRVSHRDVEIALT